MSEIAAHGLAVDPPAGWEGRIFRRPEYGDVGASEVPGPPGPPGERTFPVLHAATIPLPADAADYGSDVVDELKATDALVVLKEFDAAAGGTALFARDGMPRTLASTDFDTAMLQRSLAGQGGTQVFFHEVGRAFCLYVVLGGFDRRAEVIPGVNEVLAGIRIEPNQPSVP